MNELHETSLQQIVFGWLLVLAVNYVLATGSILAFTESIDIANEA